jgi:uncharacterized protein (DUF433 family)
MVLAYGERRTGNRERGDAVASLSTGYNGIVSNREFPLIVRDPEILGGKPCIRGTRISVPFILELIASGGTVDDIVHGWPGLTPEAIEQAVRYAARFLEDDVLVAVNVGL